MEINKLTLKFFDTSFLLAYIEERLKKEFYKIYNKTMNKQQIVMYMKNFLNKNGATDIQTKIILNTINSYYDTKGNLLYS